jgi:hypothetical protein
VQQEHEDEHEPGRQQDVHGGAQGLAELPSQPGAGWPKQVGWRLGRVGAGRTRFVAENRGSDEQPGDEEAPGDKIEARAAAFAHGRRLRGRTRRVWHLHYPG